MTKVLRCFVVTGLPLMLLSGCSTLLGWVGFGPDYADIDTLQVVAMADANQDTAGNPTATQLDIVLALSPLAQQQLPATAPQWFTQKRALLDSLPQDLAVVSLQLPPGTSIKAVALPDNADKALQVVAYSQYFALAGQNRLDLTRVRKAKLVLRSQDLTLINLDD
ncbi:hypothetical protein [Gallaecimonas mangrovi]|uniref:hypothetical protein n=1 Tax=Gallaecimonas mangrovi TaxID=2291597 RepID=UPI000E1FF697|nr:hypothetical protein [Gallaecimonas mangrovi]